MNDKDQFENYYLNYFCSLILIAFTIYINILPESHKYFNKLFFIDIIILFLTVPITLNFIAQRLFLGKKYQFANYLLKCSNKLNQINQIIPGNPFAFDKNQALTLELICLIRLEQGIEAENTANYLINVYEHETPPNNFKISEIYSLLGIALKLQGKYDASSKAQQKSIEIIETDPSTNKLDIANKLSDLSASLYLKGALKEALMYGNRALALRKLASLNDKSQEITYAMNLNNLANIYTRIHDYQQAENLYQESLDIKLKYFGEQSQEAVLGYNNLGWVNLKQANYEKALNYLTQAIAIAENINIDKSLSIYQHLLCNLGNTYTKLNQYDLAKVNLLESLTTREKTNSPELHESYHSLAILYSATNENDLAKTYFIKALNLKEKLFGKSNYHAKETLNDYAIFLRKTNQIATAITIEKQAQSIKEPFTN